MTIIRHLDPKLGSNGPRFRTQECVGGMSSHISRKGLKLTSEREEFKSPTETVGYVGFLSRPTNLSSKDGQIRRKDRGRRLLTGSSLESRRTGDGGLDCPIHSHPPPTRTGGPPPFTQIRRVFSSRYLFFTSPLACDNFSPVSSPYLWRPQS